MSPDAILNELLSLGAELSVRNGRLVCAAPPGSISQSLRQMMAANKPSLIGLVEETNQTSIGRSNPVTIAPKCESYLLSIAQEAMWLSENAAVGSPQNNLCTAIAFDSMSKAMRAEAALNTVIARHDILRAHFPIRDGLPVLCIREDLNLLVPVENLSDTAEFPTNENLLKTTQQEARRTFDLEQGPLVRGRIIAAGDSSYILILTFHHLVMDGWSSTIFKQEFIEAMIAGSSLPAVDHQYLDFIAWQRRLWSKKAEQPGLAYWRDKLSDLKVLDIPADRPRRAEQRHRGNRVKLVVSHELKLTLATLTKQTKATPFMVLISIWTALLSRYAGQDSLVVGFPAANRLRNEWHNTIGLFTNLLAIKVDLSDKPSFLKFLGRVRDLCLGAYARQDMPFEKIVGFLSGARTPGYTPICQAIFSYDEFVAGDFSPGAPGQEWVRVDTKTSKFDLALHVTSTTEELVLSLEYDTDLFEKTTVTAMLNAFVVLLSEVVRAPEKELSSLPLTTPKQGQFLKQLGQGPKSNVPLRSLQEFVAEQALRSPERLALSWESGTLTYATLMHNADQLAECLLQNGVKPGEIVGVFTGRRPETIVAALAALMVGATYLPLDPKYSNPNLIAMIEDALPVIIICQAHNHDRACVLSGQANDVVTLVASIDQTPGHFSLPTIDVAVDCGSAAYIIYTSGSTGTPNGVAVSHRAIMNRILWGQDTYPLDPGDRVLQVSSPSFDFAIWEIFAPLVFGGEIVLAPDNLEYDVDRMANFMHKESIAAARFPPSLLALLAQTKGLRFATSLKWLFSGGESLACNSVERLMNLLPNTTLFNQYGPAEAAVDVCAWRCQSNDSGARVPIGFPISNIYILILDQFGNQVPQGSPGELCIGGLGLANGYINRPALERDRFITSRHGPGQRLYKSGDIARFRFDGAIEFLGRRDEQIAIHGHRVELGEIDAALCQYPAISEAATALKTEVEGRTCLVAVFTSNSDQIPASGDLRAFLKTRLPHHKIPNYFTAIQSIPRHPSGKIDRAKISTLALIDRDRVTGSNLLLKQENSPTQELLTQIWQEILQQKSVNSEDDFFLVGGNSLLAVQLISRVRERLQVELTMANIFERSRFDELSRYVGSGGAKAATVPSIPDVLPDASSVPSFSQEPVLLAEHHLPGLGLFNVVRVLECEGALDITHFTTSLEILAERHPLLRTRFTAAGKGSMLLSVDSDLPVPLTCINKLNEVPDALDLTNAEDALTSISLESPPLWRCFCVRKKTDSHSIIFVFHHSICDEWSIDLFFRELKAVYTSLARKQAVENQSTPTHFFSFVAWQRELIDSEEGQRQFAYWWRRLAQPLQRLSFNGAHVADGESSLRVGRIKSKKNEISLSFIQDACTKHGVTIFMAVASAFSVALARAARINDVRIGVQLANRSREKFEDGFGLYANTIVIRTKLDALKTQHDLLYHLRNTICEAHEHQDLPFEYLAERLQREEGFSKDDLFQAMIIYQQKRQSPDHESDNIKWNLGETVLPNHGVMLTTCSVILIVSEIEESLSLSLVYKKNALSINSSRKLIDDVNKVLISVLDPVNAPLEHDAFR